eukprot:TRINITY_DN6217_c0_g1_i1.p1 TRINITY_DN6217_c0_g1~~TRINITY_DN6217_c0_g1_i1.p1  ORF type:complete len:385 (+),score=48.52 TRINITY_DN6217_c0_g1_i1:166-1155(+)
MAFAMFIAFSAIQTTPGIKAAISAMTWFQFLIVLSVIRQRKRGTFMHYATKKPITSTWAYIRRVCQLQDVRTDRLWHTLTSAEQASYLKELFAFSVYASITLAISLSVLLHEQILYRNLACRSGLDAYESRLLCHHHQSVSPLETGITSSTGADARFSARLSLAVWYIANIAAFVGSMLAADVASRVCFLPLGIAKIPLLNHPWKSTTLGEFWGRRWNTSVQPVLKTCFFDPAVKTWRLPLVAGVFFAFAGSGFLHAMPIWMAGGRWLDGLAMLSFFILNAGAVLADHAMQAMGMPFLISYSTAWLALIGFLPMVIHCLYMANYELYDL